MGERAAVDEALHSDRFVVRIVAVVVKGASQPFVPFDDGVRQRADSIRLLLQVVNDFRAEIAAGRRQFPAFQVFEIEEVISFFGRPERRRRAVFPAVGVAGEVSQLLAGVAVERGDFVRQFGGGRFRNTGVAVHPPAGRQAGRDAEDDAREDD